MPEETFIDTCLKRSYPTFSAMDTDNTDTHLENTCQAKKSLLSKFIDFSIFISCRQSLPMPFFL